MDKPAEFLLYDYLNDSIEAALPDDVLFEAELHDTVFQRIQSDRGVRISSPASDLAPGPGMEIKEFDVEIVIVCFSKVEGKDKKDRQPATVDVFNISKAVYGLLLADSTLGGRVCDLLARRGTRGYDTLNGAAYAVANLPIVINPRELGY